MLDNFPGLPPLSDVDKQEIVIATNYSSFRSLKDFLLDVVALNLTDLSQILDYINKNTVVVYRQSELDRYKNDNRVALQGIVRDWPWD
jgi:hypothetical protein